MSVKIGAGSFTRTGFSRSFGCCGHWMFCDMGKKECFYKEQDPEVPEGCACYRRHHSQPSQNEITFIEREHGQLSFF